MKLIWFLTLFIRCCGEVSYSCYLYSVLYKGLKIIQTPSLYAHFLLLTEFQMGKHSILPDNIHSITQNGTFFKCFANLFKNLSLNLSIQTLHPISWRNPSKPLFLQQFCYCCGDSKLLLSLFDIALPVLRGIAPHVNVALTSDDVHSWCSKSTQAKLGSHVA